MNIVYTSNNGFVPQIGASIISICENNIQEPKINFYIISSGISNNNKELLKKAIHKYNRQIEIIELKSLDNFFDFSYDTKGWNPIVLARLVVDKLLPSKINKILYIDGDTIIRGSLKKLWNTDLSNKTFAMSIEPTVDYDRKCKLGLKDYPYYNAGVMLINLKRFRDIDASKTILNYYNKHNRKVFAPDQDAINAAMRDEIITISLKYNFYNIFYQYPYNYMKKLMKNVKYIKKEEYEEAVKNPCIIHYLGEERPWRAGNHHKYKDDYIKYLNMSPWAGQNMEKGWQLYFVCFYIFNILTKPFPNIRYNIINYLIPKFMEHRAKKLQKEKLYSKVNHTFVVLAYKESQYLETCIKSVINQKFKSNVIIATTTDNEYIRNLAKKFKLKVITGEHTTIGGDFDFAIRCTDTELVTIAHQDDVYDADYSEKIVEKFIKYPDSVIIFSNYYEIRDEKKIKNNINLIIKRILLFPLKFNKISNKTFIKRMSIKFGNSICCPSVTFVKKNIPDKIFESNFKCNVDWYAWEKLSKLSGGGRFTYIKYPIMGHRISEVSTTTNIINSGIRTKEDLIMFKKFWPTPIAKFFNSIYKKSEDSNNLEKNHKK